MSTQGYVPVARILRTHGLKGEVVVTDLTATSLSWLVGHRLWVVPPPYDVRHVTVQRVRHNPKATLVTFSEVQGIDAAKRLAGCELLADASVIPCVQPISSPPDVTGFDVTDPDHGTLGAVTETIVTGANDVWVVQGPFGEVLIPVIDDVVDVIDVAKRHITVHLLDGLLPERGSR